MILQHPPFDPPQSGQGAPHCTVSAARKHSRKIEMAGVHDSPKSVAGPGGFAPGDLPLPLSLEEAHKEIMELRFEVESLRAQVLASPKRKRATSELADGTKLDDIAIDEMVAMRRIFDVIDTNNNGCVTATDIGKLHASLGEPLEEGEEAKALEAMGGSDGEIDFPTFMRFWHDTRMMRYKEVVRGSKDAKAKWREQYQQRFKFVQAKVTPELAHLTVDTEGVAGSLDYRVKFYSTAGAGKHQISPWHDVPLKNDDGTFNLVVEIPKWTRNKYEICTTEPFNPIKQDVKNGKPRVYAWGDMPFNYGAFPQTWEDPSHRSDATGCIGDNDPIDVVDIGSKQWAVGSVVRVKILGVIALIDDGETDWKVITISAEDKLAEDLDDIDDVRKIIPGASECLIHWLKMYKSTYDPPIMNKIAFDEKAQGREFATGVVEETHDAWKRLIAMKGSKAVLG